MMDAQENGEEWILDVAERLLTHHGFAVTSILDTTQELGINLPHSHHSSSCNVRRVRTTCSVDTSLSYSEPPTISVTTCSASGRLTPHAESFIRHCARVS